MTAKSLDSLLKSSKNRDLGDIVQKAKAMGDLTGRLQQHLPPELAEGLLAANLGETGELVLVSPSSAWASRLRFEEARVLAAAQDSGYSVNELTVKVSRRQT